MAEGQDGKFPPEITLSDNDPKKGQYKLTLTLPNMKVKKKFMSAATIANGECKVNTSTKRIEVSARIDHEGASETYKYEKNLPEEVKKADYELKDEEIIFKFTKSNDESMGQYTDYFRRKT